MESSQPSQSGSSEENDNKRYVRATVVEGHYRKIETKFYKRKIVKEKVWEGDSLLMREKVIYELQKEKTKTKTEYDNVGSKSSWKNTALAGWWGVVGGAGTLYLETLAFLASCIYESDTPMLLANWGRALVHKPQQVDKSDFEISENIEISFLILLIFALMAFLVIFGVTRGLQYFFPGLCYSDTKVEELTETEMSERIPLNSKRGLPLQHEEYTEEILMGSSSEEAEELSEEEKKICCC